MCYLKLLRLLETFRLHLKLDVLFLKLLRLFKTFWNLQMRFEMRCAIWNFWDLLKLSENFRFYLKWDVLFETFETSWNILKPSDFTVKLDVLFETFFLKLFETFRFHLKWDVLFETFETFWNFLKLSDYTWNEICYLKLLGLLETFWNFQMGLAKRCTKYLNFQIRIEMKCTIWNFWDILKLFETFRLHLKWDVLFETFETSWNWGLIHLFSLFAQHWYFFFRSD